MNDTDRKFWPFGPQTSVVATIIIVLGLLIIILVLKALISWPGEKSEPTILIGILLISLLPVLLALVDVIIERGGRFKVGGMEIDFAKDSMGPSDFAVPVNVGLPDFAVDRSRTPYILDAFKKIAKYDVAIINLKEGQAWWETRLVVLLAGAVRHLKPEIIVFVAKDGGTDECFQGWSHPNELLSILLQADPQYLRSFHAAKAAARQWKLVEPKNPIDPANPGASPHKPEWIKTGIAAMHEGAAFDDKGLPDELFEEKLLAWDLGMHVESMYAPIKITIARLEELFRPVLHKEIIDKRWPAERQRTEILSSDSEYLVITNNGKYSTIVSKLTVLNSIVRRLVQNK